VLGPSVFHILEAERKSEKGEKTVEGTGMESMEGRLNLGSRGRK
jgi:hypothetical protein